MKRPMHRTHFCWPDETKPWSGVLKDTSPSMWLAPKNEQTHRCQRCGYFVWRA